jgi:hypothetical protein
MLRALALDIVIAALVAFAIACDDETAPSGAAPTALPTRAVTAEAGAVWAPAPGTTWQWQLQGEIATSVDVVAYDIDLFDTPESTIDTLHAQGRIVICYFSAGSLEEGRPDKDQFAEEDAGEQLENWPDERWLDILSPNVRRIMVRRLDLAVAKGCDGVEPDNVDAYDNERGFELTEADQLDYNRFLADEAHARGLSVGLKNALGLVVALEPSFDWALNEECVAFDECDALAPFLAARKAVFHVEYVDDEADGEALRNEVCADPTVPGFSTLIKTPDLDAWRLAC